MPLNNFVFSNAQSIEDINDQTMMEVECPGPYLHPNHRSNIHLSEQEVVSLKHALKTKHP